MVQTTWTIDVGCGANKIRGSIGVDIHKKPDVDVLASAEYLPFRSGSIDHVYSRRCIQHVQNDQQTAHEILRVLKPQGSATIIVATILGWLYYQLKHLRRQRPYQTFHLYTTSRLRRLFQCGRPVQVTTVKTPHRGGRDYQVNVT